MIIIFTTFHKTTDALKIGQALLKHRLIACYNFFPVESAYWWQGKIEDAKEILMILKTRETNFSKIESYVKKHSGYEVPEIVAVKTAKVNSSYLAWLNKELL